MQQLLPYVFFLACPISMGLMMWMMMRHDSDRHISRPSATDTRIADLESQVNAMRRIVGDPVSAAPTHSNDR